MTQHRAAGEDRAAGEVRAARREFDSVVAEIRRVPGFESFLAEPGLDDVITASIPHPLCYVSAATEGGFAFVVRGGNVEHVPLPCLTSKAANDAVAAHLEGYYSFREHVVRGDGSTRDGELALDKWAAELDACTQWLWGAVMGPLLTRVGSEPEITLITGGLLGLLPLHAAWRPDESAPCGRHHAVDEVAIGYAPSARALAAAWERAGRAGTGGVLAVADPRPLPAGLAPLAPAPLERLVPAAGTGTAPDRAVLVTGERATLDLVRAELPRARVLHFAGHGVTDLACPLESRLLLADGQALTVGDLLALRTNVRLAVLTACEIAMPGTDLPEEAVGLPAGLLQAGVAGVVATLWAAHHLTTTMVAVEFYRRWRAGGSPARALRQAQRWVRDSTNAEKMAAWNAASDLPGQVVEHLCGELSLRAPQARDESPVHRWAALQHMGA